MDCRNYGGGDDEEHQTTQAVFSVDLMAASEGRMTLPIKLDVNWSSSEQANSAPPLSVTDSAMAPSARMLKNRKRGSTLTNTASNSGHAKCAC